MSIYSHKRINKSQISVVFTRKFDMMRQNAFVLLNFVKSVQILNYIFPLNQNLNCFYLSNSKNKTKRSRIESKVRQVNKRRRFIAAAHEPNQVKSVQRIQTSRLVITRSRFHATTSYHQHEYKQHKIKQISIKELSVLQ